MNKRIAQIRSEEGQTIIVVCFVMIGMIALVGLALDGGNMFLQRREVQNAVDASTMAGTRLLAKAICGEAINDEAIAAEINKFAESNGIADTNENPGDAINANVSAVYVNFDLNELGQVGAGSIPAGATGVEVSINKTEQTFFIRVVGVSEFEVSANAMSMTSPPSSVGSGVRPVAVPAEVLDNVDIGDELTFSFSNNCDDGESCAVSWTAGAGGSMSHRGWASLGYAFNQGEDPSWGRDKIANASNANITAWMLNGYSDNPFYSDYVGGVYGDYILASPGLRQSSIAAADDIIGQIIILPVFDYFVEEDDIPAPKPGDAPNADYYHIVGFLGVEVLGANPTNEHSFSGVVRNVILGFGAVSPGEGYGEPNACETNMMVINLWD